MSLVGGTSRMGMLFIFVMRFYRPGRERDGKRVRNEIEIMKFNFGYY